MSKAGEKLIKSVKEAVAIAKGEMEPARVTVVQRGEAMNKRDWFERHAKAAPPDPNKDYNAVLEQTVDQRGEAMSLLERLQRIYRAGGAEAIREAIERLERYETALREIVGANGSGLNHAAACDAMTAIARKALGEEKP